LYKPLKKWLKDRYKKKEWIRDRLLEEMDTYALTKDPYLQRLMKSRGGVPYVRQVNSLLISYGTVPAQSSHIDMVGPLYQTVLLLTSSPPTEVFPVQNLMNTQSEKLGVEDFVALVCRWSGSNVTVTVRDDMIRAIRSVRAAVDLIEQYGWLFATTDTKAQAHREAKERMPGQGAPVCGYLGFPGSVIHRGPACAEFRLSAFASYGQASDEPYDEDVQHTAPSLYANLSDLIFERMKTREAQLEFQRVGSALLSEEAAGPADFFKFDKYGDDISKWNPEEVSAGHLMGAAHARFVKMWTDDLDMLCTDKQAYCGKYFKTGDNDDDAAQKPQKSRKRQAKGH
jgi:hypothetical protein